jgi:hypothetical protein
MLHHLNAADVEGRGEGMFFPDGRSAKKPIAVHSSAGARHVSPGRFKYGRHLDSYR